MSIADLDTLYDAYVAALEAADYATAIAKLMAIKARLATTPNVSHSFGGSNQGVTWTAADITSLIRECRQLQAAATHATVGGLQRSKVTYARADAADGY